MKLPKPSLGLKLSFGTSLVLTVVFITIFSIIGFEKPQLFHQGRWWVLILLTVIFSATTVFLFTYSIVERPLNSMRRIMLQSEKKSFLLRVPVKTKDVIGDLGSVFNRMLQKVTTLDAFKIETERDLIMAQEELKYKKALEEKSKTIAKTNKALENKLREQSLLIDMARMLTSTIEKENLFQVIGEPLTTKLGIRDFALFLYNVEKQILEVKALMGFKNPEAIKKITFAVGEGVSGQVIKSCKKIYIPDTHKESQYLYYKGERFEDGSFLSLPLVFQDNLIGVLNFTRPDPYAFSDEEIDLLEAAASQMAIALMNAKLYDTMKEVAILDELTQIYNRRYFYQILPQEVVRAKRFRKQTSLLMIDIDHFKLYNDTYGHIAGDILLREFAQLIPHYLREVDFWARFGGEEFAVILPNTSKASSKIVATKILDAISKHNFPKSSSQPGGRLTVSIGIASYPVDARDYEVLVKNADAALYKAKRKGRNRFELFLKPRKKKPVKKDKTKTDSDSGKVMGEVHHLFKTQS